MNAQFLFLSAGRSNSFLKSELKKFYNFFESENLRGRQDHSQVSCIYPSFNREKNEAREEACIVERSINWNSAEVDEIEDNFPVEAFLKENTYLEDLYKLAEHLHSFADSNLVKSDSSILHILWCVDSYIPCPSEAVELYGVFERFILWHNASIKVITNNEEAIGDWISFLPLQIIKSCSEILQEICSILWTGCLAFACQEKSNSVFTPAVVLTASNDERRNETPSLFAELSSSYVLQTAEVFSTVELSSIPLCFLRKGSLCYLAPCPSLRSTSDRQEVIDVLTEFTSKREVGTLFRLRFTSDPSAFQGGNGSSHLTTDYWKQRVVEGNVQTVPPVDPKGPYESLVFLLMPSDGKNGKFECLVLQDPCLYGDTFMNIVRDHLDNKPQFCDEQVKRKIRSMITDSFLLSEVQDFALSYMLLNYPTEIRKSLLKNNVDLKSLSSAEMDMIGQLSNNQLASILESVEVFPKVQLLPPDRDFIAEVDCPKESWPEYQALLQYEKEMKKNAVTRLSSDDFLCGLAPPSSVRHFDNLDLDFLMSKLKVESSLSLPKSNVSTSRGYDWLKLLTWSEALTTKFHGICYNTGKKSEKLERTCALMRQQVITNDSSSTCSLFVARETNARSKKTNCLALGRGTTKNVASKSLIVDNKKPNRRKQFLGDEDTCSVSSSIRSSNLRGCQMFQRSKAVMSELERTDIERTLRPSEILSAKQPLNHAPNRKPRPPPLSKHVAADLSEIHKQKLRNVVLGALEGHGVSMKHPLFKLCFKKLFVVCKPFALDIAGQGSTTRNFERIAGDHVKQVVDFEFRKLRGI